MTDQNTQNLQERITVSIVDPSDLAQLKQHNIGEVVGVISFGDSKEFQKIIDQDIPAIFSHSGYRTEEGRYVDSTDQGPLQLFTIKNAKNIITDTYGTIKYAESGEYLVGSIEVEEPEGANGNVLSDIAERSYNDMYALMQKTGKHTLVRVGNYVTDILADTMMTIDGKEIPTIRYKAFCTGRSISMENTFKFTDTKQMPTATGIGNHFSKRYVKIFFIATNRDDVENHKNPMQTNPTDYKADAYGITQIPGQLSLPKFSRATTLANYNMLFVGGTASILGQDVVHEGDVVKQTLQALQNVRYTMEEAEKNTGLKYCNLPIVLKVFVKHKADFDAIKQAIENKELNPLHNPIIDIVYTHGDVCREQRLVEVSCETIDPETARIVLDHKLKKNASQEQKIQQKLAQIRDISE